MERSAVRTGRVGSGQAGDEEDVASIFVQSFKPDLFQVLPDGSMVSPPRPGESMVIRKVEKEAV